MTKEMRDRMAKLRTLAPKLNAATDAAAKVIADAEKFLVGVGIGIAAETGSFHVSEPTIEFDAPSAEGRVVSEFSLAFGRVSGKFQVHVVETVRHEYDRSRGDWETLATDRTPWSSCSRDIKLRSIEMLDPLLAEILATAEKIEQSAVASTRAVQGVVGGLDTEDAKPEPNCVAVVCQYHDSDVRTTFPGFRGPQREEALTQNEWGLMVEGTDCDGIVAIRMGLRGALTLTLTMGPEDARHVAAKLIRQADVEDAKLDEEDED